ncbi:MAG: aldehyde dehydrogenase family protein [Microthrixaceae bacterium]
MTDPQLLDRRRFYIGGAWVEPDSPNDALVLDPSTEEAAAVISLGSEADTDAAVGAARAAFPAWSETDPSVRVGLLERLLEVYEARSEALATALSLEMGAPIDLARNSQVTAGSWHLRNTIAALASFAFDRPLDEDSPGDRILYEPVGVCALITPWNWPMNQVTLKVGPALGVGCTVVLKPSEIAPLSSALFAELVHEAGFPPGVFNLVNGDGAGVGTWLSGHRDVDMVSFTGSTRAGTAVTTNSADSIKRVALELGGKGANLVFADADDGAVERGVRHCFNNSGQSCNAPTRMLVERPAYDEAVATARRIAEETTVGAPDAPGRHLGPVVSEAQFDKIQALIDSGVREGASLVAGGPGRPEDHEVGYYVRPTVFADVTPTMTIARDEIFGPVLSILPFDTEEEAVAIANDTVFGLTNYVQTTDADKARRVARRLRSGMVEMNGRPRSAGSPFGGYGQSGNGREGGVWGLEEFLEVKAVSGWT